MEYLNETVSKSSLKKKTGHDTNVNSYYLSQYIDCPHCDRYYGKSTSIYALNQHILSFHAELIGTNFRRSNDYCLSWNHKYFGVFEECSYCGRFFNECCKFHKTKKSLCPGIYNGRWLIGHKENYLTKTIRIKKCYQSYKNFCKEFLSKDVVRCINKIFIGEFGQKHNLKLYKSGNGEGIVKKIYILIDIKRKNIYVGECVMEMSMRIKNHNSEAKKTDKKFWDDVQKCHFVYTVVGVDPDGDIRDKGVITKVERDIWQLLKDFSGYHVVNRTTY